MKWWIQSDDLCFSGVSLGHTQHQKQDQSQLFQHEAPREQRVAASVDYRQPPPQSQD